MKPGHIITDTPARYAAAIAAAAACGMTITAGPEPPDGTKYVFQDVDPHADLLALAQKLHRSDGRIVRSATAVVENLRKAPPPLIEPPRVRVVPGRQRRIRNTALIIAYCYESDIRHGATMQALAQLGRLNPMPRVYVAHLAFEDERPEARGALADIVRENGWQYVVVPGYPRHKAVFHKEDLYNLIVRNHARERYLIFLDADTYPARADWARMTRNALQRVGDDTILQPWRHFRDTEDHALAGLSMAANYVDHARTFTTHANPGLSIAMTRACFESLGGFPTSCPAGASDTMLIYEIAHGRYEPDYLAHVPYFAAGRRSVPAKDLDYVAVDMIHCHHGTKTSRCYQGRHEILQAFWPWGSDVYCDSQRLLSCRPGCPLQRALSRRREAVTRQDVIRIVRESGHDRPMFCEVRDFERAKTADPAYWTGRWDYYRTARTMLRSLDLRGRFLEIGALGNPLILNAEQMGLWDRDGDCTRHDAARAPWPYPDRRFALVAALQVVEHLSDQATYFLEAARVAEWVLVSLPWQWTRGAPNHIGIDWDQVNRWTGAAEPYDSELADGNRMLILYRSRDILASAGHTAILEQLNVLD